MRTVKALLLAGGLLAGLPSLAHAQWYVGADVGADYTQGTKVTAGNNGKTNYNWGPVGLIEGGYNFGGPAIELEGGYRTNDVNKVNGLHGSNSADTYSFMVNGIYDFLPTSVWHPFVGAGIGAAHVGSNDISANGNWLYSGASWQFAYQGIAGLGYDITQNLEIKTQYRYFATSDYGVTGANGGTGSASYKNHSVLVGLTYKFNPPAPVVETPAPIAAPAPTPVPPKPAPAPQKNYLVFFDFNKADITPEAARIISQAAVAAQSVGITRVNVTGHTDLAGSDKYNMTLSLKRANAVRDSLVRQGVPANEIAVVAKGKADPLVATKDGVREPQNRRVEIVLQ